METAMQYDWDSVQVGKPEMNSSQNFFRKFAKLDKLANDTI